MNRGVGGVLLKSRILQRAEWPLRAHRTLAPNPGCYPASFMVGMLRFGMANHKGFSQ
jgi:hypothetical protein